MKKSEQLSIWTIYKYPKDYPTKFVARRHEVRTVYHYPTDEHIVADDYETLNKEMQDRHLFCIGRQPGDDPVIVESWI